MLVDEPKCLLLKVRGERAAFLTPMSTRSMHVGQVRALINQSSMHLMW